MCVFCNAVLPCADSRGLSLWWSHSEHHPSVMLLPPLTSSPWPLSLSERSAPSFPSSSSLLSFSCLGPHIHLQCLILHFQPSPWKSSCLVGVQSSSRLLLPSAPAAALVWPLASTEFSRRHANTLLSPPLLPPINCPPCSFFCAASPAVSPSVFSSC